MKLPLTEEKLRLQSMVTSIGDTATDFEPCFHDFSYTEYPDVSDVETGIRRSALRVIICLMTIAVIIQASSA